MVFYRLAMIIIVGIAAGIIFALKQRKITKLNVDFQTEKEGRVRAEQKNSRIPELEQELKEKDKSLSRDNCLSSL